MTKQKTETAFAKFIIVGCIAILLAMAFGGCNPQRQLLKAYNIVAADIPTSPINKPKLIGWINANFPIQEKVIIKDSVVYDYFESEKHDTITVNKENEVFKYIYKIDTLVVSKFKTKEIKFKDTTGNYLMHLEHSRLLDTINVYKANKAILNADLTNTTNQLKKANSLVSKWFWLFVLACIVGFASHFLRSKLF